MKILITQLARFGDIYQSWPTIRAVKRKYPQAEVHLLVRKRFAAALEGVGIECTVHQMDTAHLLEPVYGVRTSTGASLRRLSEWVDRLGEIGFDEIINLSFSPFSSYLSRSLSRENTVVRGYTRFDDGFLAIPDDASAYFYAQVGVGRHNRVHLAELFASVAEVDVQDSDWTLLDYQRNPGQKDRIFESHEIPTRDPYLVLHVGASDSHKTLSAERWSATCRRLLQWWQGRIILVGSPSEVLIGQRILEGVCSSRVHSLVGKTRLSELFPLLSSARIVIGGDSVVMQMASLAQVECLNVSFPTVNFWETGPKEPGSRILLVGGSQAPNPESMAKEIWHLLEGLTPEGDVAFATGESPVWFEHSGISANTEFSWDLIRAIYLGADFPAPPSTLAVHGFHRIYELAELAIAQIEVIHNEGARAVAAEILGQVDGLMGSVRRMVPDLDPLISWFETEKIRIGPSSVVELAEQTRRIFESLKMVASLYMGREGIGIHGLEEGHADDNLVS
ncbi:MAG: glycosyltransferase family 9 protein [Bdellovibrionaceae bacterium]|nr:glycosyltransferase family 9 protein [Bdellovibrionales bacterium]MCB9084838.1 glycosyltransferase family 9 protein [Pseudobdellovibrionaceae bacterium]